MKWPKHHKAWCKNYGAAWLIFGKTCKYLPHANIFWENMPIKVKNCDGWFRRKFPKAAPQITTQREMNAS